MRNTRPKHARLALFASATLILLAYGGSMPAQAQETTDQTTGDAGTVAESTTVSTGTLTLTLEAAGSLTPAANTTLTFSANATVTDVLVDVGDQVTAGQVVARLDTSTADSNIRVAELQLEQAQLSLDSVLAPPTEIEINLAEAQVALAQAQLYSASNSGSDPETEAEIARLELELARNSLWQTQINRDVRVEQENERGNGVTWVEQQQFDQSVNNAEDSVTLAESAYQEALNPTTSSSSTTSAYASLVNAQADLESLLEGASDSEIRQAEIQVEEAQMNLDSARETLDEYVLTAPFDGIIVDQALIVGVYPPATGAMTLLDPTRYTMDLSIAEADVVNVSEGQSVALSVQTFPDADITGTISSIDTTATVSSQLVTYNAQVELDATDVELRPNMSATATVILNQLSNVVLIPNRFISTSSTTGETIVTVETSPGVYTEMPITIGERSTSESQILSGVEVGQTLVIIARETDAAESANGALGGLLGGGGGPVTIPGGGGNFQPPAGGFPGGGGGFPGGG